MAMKSPSFSGWYMTEEKVLIKSYYPEIGAISIRPNSVGFLGGDEGRVQSLKRLQKNRTMDNLQKVNRIV
jgi:hypothetical protein